MNDIKFSVIIPVCNAESYILQCIDSVLNQTYMNYEIVVVNDGSTDQTLKVIQTNYKNNKNVIIYNKENTGVSDSRNYALTKITGDWITFLDADDWLEETALEFIYKKIKKENPDIIQSNLYVNYVNFQEILYDGMKDQAIGEKSRNYLLETIISMNYSTKKYNAIYGNCRCAGGKFYHSKLIKKSGIVFPIELKVFEDGIFNLYLYSKSKKTLIAKDPIYHYRRNNLSATQKYNKNQLEQNELILEKLEDFINDSQNYDLLESYYYCIFDLLLVAIDNIVKVSSLGKMIKVCKEIKEITKIGLYNQCLTQIKSDFLSTKDRIIYFALKKNLYFIVYVIYRTKKIMKDIRRG